MTRKLTAKDLLKEVRQLKKLAYSDTELIRAMTKDGISKSNAQKILILVEDAIEEMWSGAGWRAIESFNRKAEKLGLDPNSSSAMKINEYLMSQS